MLLRTGLALAGLLAIAQSASAEVYCKTGRRAEGMCDAAGP